MDFRGCRLQVFLVSRDEDDGRKISREPEGGGSSDALACNRHHGDGFDVHGIDLYRESVFRAASRMTSVTTAGSEYMGVWSTG
jgi:hypothetical protein